MFLIQQLLNRWRHTLMKSVVRSNVSSSFLFRRTALLDDTIRYISSSFLLDEPICASYALMRCIEFFLHSARFVFPDEDEAEKTIFPDMDMFQPFSYRTCPITECLLYLVSLYLVGTYSTSQKRAKRN